MKDDKICWICNKVNRSCNKRQIQCEKCKVWFHLSCTRSMNDALMNKAASWICCKCGQSNYCDNLFDDFGISTEPNAFDLNSSDEEQDYCNDVSEQMTNQDKGRIHV